MEHFNPISESGQISARSSGCSGTGGKRPDLRKPLPKNTFLNGFHFEHLIGRGSFSLVYSAVENTIIDRIPVDKSYTRISYADEEKLILSGADPAVLEIVRFEQVHDINIFNRPSLGPEDAKVTLVVFDDYQ